MSELDLGTLIVDIAADLADFDKGVGQLHGKLDDVEVSAGGIRTALEAAFGGAVVGGIAALVHASSEAQEAQIRLAAALKASGQSADTSAYNRLGQEIQQLTTFDDDAVVAASALGVRLGLNQKQIEGLMPLVADLAAATGRDLSDAMRMAAISIASGETRALKEAGVVLDDHAKETFKNADQQERLAIVMEKLKGTVGGTAAEMSKTADGAMAQMRNEAQNLAEALGDIFSPSIVDILHEITAQIKELQSLFSGLGDIAGSLVDVLTAPFKALLKYNRFLLDLLGQVKETVAGPDEMALVPLVDERGQVIGQQAPPKKGGGKKKEGMFDHMMEGAQNFDLLTAQTLAAQDAASRGLESQYSSSQPLPVAAPELPAAVDLDAAVDERLKAAAQAVSDSLNVGADNFGNEVMSDLETAGNMLGSGLLAAMGDFGNVASNAIQAGMQGGPMAAVASIGVDLLSRTQSFAKISEIMDRSMGALVNVFDLMVNGFIPIANAASHLVVIVGDLLGPVLSSLGQVFASIGLTLAAITPLLQVLQPAFDLFGNVVAVLARVVAGVMLAVLGIVTGISEAFNRVLGFIASALRKIDKVVPGDKLSDWADKIDDSKISTGKFKQSMDALSNLMHGQAQTFVTDVGDAGDAAADLGVQVPDLGSDLEGLGDAANKATEALTDVPSGYKVALARYDAIDTAAPAAAMGTTSATWGDSAQASKSATTNVIQQLVVQTNDPDELWRKIKKQQGWENFTMTGSTQGSYKPFLTPKFSTATK